MKLLVTTYIGSQYFEAIRGMFDEIVYEGMMKIGRVLTEDEMCEYIKDCDCLISEFDPVTAKVLESAKNLKLIASPRSGCHVTIDVDKANELGIPIIYVHGRTGNAVAEYAIGLMIAVSRHMARANMLIKTRQLTDDKCYTENGFCEADVNWVGSTKEKFAYLNFKGPIMEGRTLGLVGFGAIGREVAKRALSFNMKILAYDPFVKQEDVNMDVTMVDLPELMSNSDFVSLHLPVNDGTRGLVNAEVLSLMKPTAYLINTARAAIVDYDKIIDMLQKNEIAGAAFDVYPVEPLKDDSPLLDLDNVVLSPHIAGCTLDSYDTSYRTLSADMELFFAGEKPVHLFNEEIWENRRYKI